MRLDRASDCGSPRPSDLSPPQEELKDSRPLDQPRRARSSKVGYVDWTQRNESEVVEKGQELVIRAITTRGWLRLGIDLLESTLFQRETGMKVHLGGLDLGCPVCAVFPC